MFHVRWQTNKFALFPQIFILLSVLALLPGLYDGDETVTAAEGEMTEVDKVALMEQHYTAAILSHDALIEGDLERLRSRLAEIAEEELPHNAPKSWESHHELLVKAARRAGKTETLEDAASVMADVGEACGICHNALKAGQIYFWPDVPAGEEELSDAMRSHQWATERLWEGVTGPFEEAWNRGAAVLSVVRVFEEEGEGVSSSLLRLEAELRDMGLQAKVTTGLHYRAQIYGRLLMTCAECHRQAGVAIEPAKATPPWQE